jgi:hypothetical protein
MVVIPREKPVLENLNIYYLDIKKLLEHYQGEIGSGGIYFKSYAAEGVIFFDKDELLYAYYKEKGVDFSGPEAIEQLINARGKRNLSVNIYQISADEVYFWAGIPCAEKIYKDLSTEFTDLEGLIRKMSSERLTGYIDVSIGNGKEGGLIFFTNGRIMGGSFSWANNEPGASQRHQERLIRKTKEFGATFNVSRMASPKMKAERTAEVHLSQPSKPVLAMLEEFLNRLEHTVTSKKALKRDFNQLLKRKFVENAEKYAYLDPFAGEFEYSDQKITFSGAASDRELINGVVTSARELAQELRLLPELIGNLKSWSARYAKEIEEFGVKLPKDKK